MLSKKVSARDLFGERLKKFGIREHLASGKDDERSRCLTDGSQCLAVFLTEDGFVDFLTAYGVDAPERYSTRFPKRLVRDLQRAAAKSKPARRRRPRLLIADLHAAGSVNDLGPHAH